MKADNRDKSFKALSSTPRRFQLGFHRFNLRRLTAEDVTAAGSGMVMVTGTANVVLGVKDTVDQGLTLVHFSAQPEPFLTQHAP